MSFNSLVSFVNPSFVRVAAMNTLTLLMSLFTFAAEFAGIFLDRFKLMLH